MVSLILSFTLLRTYSQVCLSFLKILQFLSCQLKYTTAARLKFLKQAIKLSRLLFLTANWISSSQVKLPPLMHAIPLLCSPSYALHIIALKEQMLHSLIIKSTQNTALIIDATPFLQLIPSEELSPTSHPHNKSLSRNITFKPHNFPPIGPTPCSLIASFTLFFRYKHMFIIVRFGILIISRKRIWTLNFENVQKIHVRIYIMAF